MDDADAGKLGSLIGFEDFWLAITAYGFMEGLNEKIRLQSVRQTPGEDLAAAPIHDRHQLHKPSRHGNVGDVGCPRLIGMSDGQLPEQVGVDFMLRVQPARVRLGVDRLDSDQRHQPLGALAVDPAALPPEMSRHGTAAEERFSTFSWPIRL